LLLPGLPAPNADEAADADGDEAEEAADETPTFRELPLERLCFDEEIPLPPMPADAGEDARQDQPEFEWVHPASVQVGTLIHRELQRLCDRAQTAGKPLAPHIAVASYRRELALLGVEPEDLAAAAVRVGEALTRVWSDPVGRRILHPWAEAWSELRLCWRGPERIEHLQIDRSFVDDEGQRWIIDYKTGRHLGADLQAFLASEVERYRGQLERYAEAIAAIDPRPIRVGLYFPLLQLQQDWIPASAAGR
jgi:ATP-dependent exoDNAse (exonuclease V) beta subunit